MDNLYVPISAGKPPTDLIVRSSSASSFQSSRTSSSREWSNRRLSSQVLWCFIRDGTFLCYGLSCWAHWNCFRFGKWLKFVGRLICQNGLTNTEFQIQIVSGSFSQLWFFSLLSFFHVGRMIRLISELHIIQCGDGADEPHNTLFTGCLEQPLHCQSAVHGRRQMSRLTFQDATHLRGNYDSQSCSVLFKILFGLFLLDTTTGGWDFFGILD